MRIDKLGCDFENLIREYEEAFRLFCILKEQGEVLLFGGAVREYLDTEFNNLPRDFDLVIKKNSQNIDLDRVLEKFQYKKNRFGGYKITVDSLEFDIWELEKTWAFRENKVKCAYRDYDKKLQNTVFLNIDSIVYNLSTKNYYSEEYERAMKNKKLDIILEENPYLELNLIRAIVYKKKYTMYFSDKLRSILLEFIIRNPNYLDLMEVIQLKHYKDIKISRTDLNKEINELKLNTF